MSLSHLIAAPEMPKNLRLHDRIGSGAAGSCFLVSDITGKSLALKVVSAEWEARELESLRTFREIPAHPALTQIFSSGKLSDGRFYYTMELADNAGADGVCYQADTLALRMKNRSMALPELLRILSAVASGAEHLHRCGLFHGDIKPENILFISGSPKLADYGTLSGDHSGTAGFVPENPVSGVDRDCYALGMTLYCAWSGLDASDFPALPESFDPDEANRVRKIYLRACHSSARRRFASAADLITALENAAASGRRTFPRMRLIVSAGVVLLLLLLLSAAVFVFHHRTVEKPPEEAVIPFVPEAPDAGLSDEEIEERRTKELHAIQLKSAEEWIRKHPKELQELEEWGVSVTLDRERGGLEIRDPEYRENGGIHRVFGGWEYYQRKRYMDAKRWMREHPDEVEKIKASGITFFPDPEFGLQYRDTRNGLRGVGSVKDVLDYYKTRSSAQKSPGGRKKTETPPGT